MVMMLMFGLNRKLIFHISLVLLLLFSSPTESFKFELQSGHSKCISEDIKKNSMSVGQYSIVNPNKGHPFPDYHNVTVRVTSSNGDYYHYGDQIQSGQFSFVARMTGDHMTCFWAADHNPQTTLTIDFDWKTGVVTKGWYNVAKRGHVDLMEQEVKKLSEVVSSIHDDLWDHLREREEELKELNSTTDTRMFWMSLLSLFIILSVAGLQLWHLKTFFEKKKLI